MSVEEEIEARVEDGAEEAQEPEAAPTLEELPDEVREAIQALDEHKGQEIVVLDMRTVSGFTDFMVICTGRSEPHLQALSGAVEERLLAQRIKPSHVEGKGRGTWVLLDFMQLIVHVFTPETRSFYQLEKLWRDAPMLEWGVIETDPEAAEAVEPAESAEPVDPAE